MFVVSRKRGILKRGSAGKSDVKSGEQSKKKLVEGGGL
jgi:hypothetical protein